MEVKNLIKEAFKEKKCANVQVQVSELVQALPAHALIEVTSFETQTSFKAQLHPIYSLLTRHLPQKFLRTKDPSVVKEWLELVENHMSLFEMS